MSDPRSSSSPPRLRRSAAATAILAERLLRRRTADAPRTRIPRRPAAAPAVLSFAQERLWFLDQLAPGSAAYNVVRVYEVAGELAPAILARALGEIAARHEPLRTRFPLRDGAPAPLTGAAPGGIPVPVADLGRLPKEAGRHEAARLGREAARRPFDLGRGPLLRVLYLTCGAGRGVLALTLHHIAADGWSLDLLFRELQAIYRARLAGAEPALPDLAIDYADFAHWQRERLQGETLAKLLGSWRERLAGAPASLELPADRPRVPSPHAAGGLARLAIGPLLAEELRRLAGRRGATPFMVLLAAFYAVLHRLTGRDALIVGVPAAGRTRSELEPLIGMFVNTLALRVDACAELSGEQLLARTRDAALAAHAGQELPFEKLVEALAPERTLATAPFVQAMVALEVPAPELVLPGAALRRLEVWSGGAKLDLDVTFADLGAAGLAGTTIYDRGLFDAPTVARLHGHYLRLLAGLAAEPRRPLTELPLLAAEERHQMLCEWNDSEVGGGAAESSAEETEAATFPHLFAAQAARFPERTAAAWRGARLTFGELDRRAGRLGVRIAAQLPPGRLVALAVPRGLDFLTAMLAVWKAGSAYLPLDLEQPPAHLARILAVSGAGLVLAAPPAAAGPAGAALERALGQLAPSCRPPVLPVAAAAGLPAPPPSGLPAPPPSGETPPVAPRAAPQAAALRAAPVPARLSSHDLAYVIFTSGSTGTPKGVMLEHGGMLNHLLAKVESLGITAADRIAQNAPPTFDISIWQLLAPLLAGGEVEIVPDEEARDPARLLAAVERRGITVLEVVPSLLRFLIDHLEESAAAGRGRPALAALRVLVPTGEALPVELCRRWLALYPRVPLLNAYGPTECSDDVTHRVVREVPEGPRPHVPLGRPIRNLRVWVLDRLMLPAPIGVIGEIYCGGRGVGRGYLGDVALTARALLPDPFAAAPGSRLYRTGDLGRWLPAGELEFLGRADHQVKVRGFRIELGEIEAALARHPAVRAAAALAFTDAAGGRRLIAWVAYQLTGDPAADLRGYLAALLPDYMVPWMVAPLPELPLTATGKIDRRGLERLSLELAASVPARERRAPRTALERELAGLWLAALGPVGVRELGVGEDFFELGGNSLTGAVLINRLQERLGEVVPVAAIFNAPTIERLARWIEERHPAAAARLEAAAAAPAPSPAAAIPRRAAHPGDPLPASFAQERLWFLDRLQPGSTLYNVPVAFWLEGALDVAALARALDEIVRRHEALRTTLHAAAAGPVQVIAPPPGPGARPLPLADLGALPPALAKPQALRLARREAARPFDLAAGPLFRAALLGLGPRRHALLLGLHHVIADGWSLGLLYRELEALYAAAVAPAAAPAATAGTAARSAAGSLAAVLPEPPIQYADFALWQRGWLAGEVIASQLAFWREALAGAPRLLELPAARPRPSVQGHRGGSRSLLLPPALATALATLARRQGSTFFLTLLGAFELLLYRHTGQDDLVVGTPAAGRNRSELEHLVGLCINTLALRTRLGGDPTFPELLARVRAAATAAFACQDVPFERLVAELQPERNLSSSPLFQVVFMVVDGALDAPALAGLRVASLPIDRGTTKFDLAFACEEQADGLRVLAEYDRDLFDPADVARLLAAFEALLEAITAAAGRRISAFPSTTRAMRHQILREWNDTAAEADRRSTLHGLFERQAERTPAALAAVLGGGPEAPRLTYGDLDRAATRWAHALRASGVGPGSLVAVYMDRCLEMVPALLAILKTGAAYVPLSTGLPAARISYILSLLDVRHAVTHPPRRAETESWRGATPLAHVLALDLLALEEAAAAPPPSPPLPAVDPAAIAYVIFTSGSTGTPKGVLVQHGPAVALIGWVNATYGIGARDRLLFTTSLSFDLSVYDVFGLLAAGGTVRIATAGELRDPRRLARVLAEEPVTFWDSAPAALQQLVPFFPAKPGDGGAGAAAAPAPGLSLVFLSGDWVPPALPGRLREAFPGTQVVALGGATEATVWSNHHLVAAVPPDWRSVPYGRPISNARYHVLDREQLPCPIGVPGDLYIGGRCLSIGYAAAPELTAWKYLPDPFAAERGGRLYRTGDRARHWADGTLEFLGRSDHQVKVRGFRIELGEIEAVLREHPAVRETVVLAREDTPGDQRLAAYFILRGGEAGASPPPSAAELRGFLAARLPDYMVPSAFVPCDAWPLSASGKLDRKALPPPGGTAGGRDRGAEPPRGPLERAIARIWEEVIGLDAVGRDQNFFDAGGHSLLMVQVQTRLRQALGREVSMVELFQHPTVAALAGVLAPGLEPPGLVPRALEPPGLEPPGTGLAGAPDPRATALASVAAAAPSAARRGRDVAIVGMAGRFPGAPDLDAFWDNLRRGVESIRFFSREELLAAGVSPSLAADPRYVPAKGALEGAELFDAAFFDYSPREAQITDPQQRLFLECAWAALEDAGYAGAPVPGGVGVFAGAAESAYAAALQADPELMRTVGAYQAAIANQRDYLPSRVSYKLDLEGPSLAVQTACSTSLVAVHLACRSLLDGECTLALAGGVAVRGSQREGYLWEEGSIASPDGHTRAFDAAARGTVTGSGVGVVVLKRLDHALAAGDHVRAVVRGSAVNNDGAKKPGFTAPSVEGQARVIRRAHQVAGVPPETISYVEAHGTGTELGDPIEIAGLTRAFRAGTDRERFCAVGSVKTNIGHLDAAAGVAGLIKTVLALEHQLLPPSLHFTRPNPNVAFAASPFYVNDAAAAWPRGAAPRRAGVSAFGIGGTNAHLVIEEAPAPRPAGAPARPLALLVLSARTATALAAATANLAAHLERCRDLDHDGLADVAWTLQVGRRRFRHRRALLAAGRDDALAALIAPAGGRLLTRDDPAGARAVAFLFPGQGAQHPGMAAAIYRAEPAFRSALDRCAEILRPELGIDLRRALWEAAPGEDAERELAQTALAQPALFAVEYALARLWMSWGVRPQAMIGHSLGEYVAACLAGVFSLEDGLRLVAERGRLMQELPPGAMLAAELSPAEAEALLAGMSGHAVPELAASNGPAAVVFSGGGEEIERLARELAGRGVEHRRLRTSHAFHSAAMEPAARRFAARLRQVALAPPRLPFVSNLTGTWITAAEATDPDYWARQLRRPVRFAAGLAALAAEPERAWLEVGPGRTLATLARRQPGRPAAVVSSLAAPRGHGSAGGGHGSGGSDTSGGDGGDASDHAALLGAVARLWLLGAEIDWAGVSGHERRRRVPLPAYPFERRRYWLPAEGAAAVPEAAEEPGGGNGAAAAFAAYAPPRGEVESAIADAWRRLLGVERLGIHDDFFELGGSSLMAVQLAARLRQELAVELPPSALLEDPTVAALAERIVAARREGGAAAGGPTAAPGSAGAAGAAGARPGGGSCLVRLQAAGEHSPLFLVHQVGGHVYSFRPLVRELGGGRPLFGLRSRGLEDGERPLASIEEMAAHYLALVRAVRPRGPYLLGGASMGGMVAFEMAQQLRAAGEEAALLALMDTPCGDQMPPRPSEADVLRQVLPSGAVLPPDAELRGLPLEERLERALAAARAEGAAAAPRGAGAAALGGYDFVEGLRLLRVLDANVAALYAYRPLPYPGAALFFRAGERPEGEPPHPELPWIDLAAAGCEVHVVPGNHFTMHEAPQVREMAARLRLRLAAAGI